MTEEKKEQKEPKKMTEEEHRKRHTELHEMFDELLADFITHNPTCLPSKTPIIELIKWSSQQTRQPVTKP